MKRLGSWLLALCLLLAVVGWQKGAAAEVAPGFESQEELISPEGSHSSGSAENGGSALVGADMGGGGAGAGETGAGGFWDWVADRGLGAVKGIGAGVIAAGGIALGALVIGASAPVLLLGAAVVGGAAYGLMVGSQHFNWTEAIVGSLIGGLSAGVGSWLSATGSAIAARVGVALADLVAGGLTGVVGYLTGSQEITWGGALGAFGLGAAASGLFMGAGAAASRFWKALGLRRTAASGGAASAMVQAALDAPDKPPGVQPNGGAPKPGSAAAGRAARPRSGYGRGAAKPGSSPGAQQQTGTNSSGRAADPVRRPSGYRKGVRDQVWETAKDSDGNVRDPLTGAIMSKEEPWDMGHKPGHEFRKHQQSARERGITRRQFLDEYNDPSHYRPELPSSNRSHRGEDRTDEYFGP